MRLLSYLAFIAKAKIDHWSSLALSMNTRKGGRNSIIASPRPDPIFPTQKCSRGRAWIVSTSTQRSPRGRDPILPTQRIPRGGDMIVSTQTRDSTDAARERGRAASVQMPAKPRNSCNESPLLSYLSMVQQQHQHQHQIFGRRKS